MDGSVGMLAIGSAAVGIVVGLLLGRIGAARERRAMATALDEARRDLETLRSSTADHFNRAGELFADLTERYVAFHRHLARGAGTLANGRTHKFPEAIVVPASAPEESAALADDSVARADG